MLFNHVHYLPTKDLGGQFLILTKNVFMYRTSIDIRPFHNISNQAIDEICCIYTHNNWKNGLEYWMWNVCMYYKITIPFQFELLM